MKTSSSDLTRMAASHQAATQQGVACLRGLHRCHVDRNRRTVARIGTALSAIPGMGPAKLEAYADGCSNCRNPTTVIAMSGHGLSSQRQYRFAEIGTQHPIGANRDSCLELAQHADAAQPYAVDECVRRRKVDLQPDGEIRVSYVVQSGELPA